MDSNRADHPNQIRECRSLWGEGWGEGEQALDRHRSEPPHPNPLPEGEREQTEPAAELSVLIAGNPSSAPEH